MAVGPYDEGIDAVSAAGDLADFAVEPDDTAAPLDLVPYSAPHHPGTEPRVVKFFDQTLHRRSRFHGHVEQHGLQRVIFDSLGSPFGFELGTGNPPHLFRIRLEERSEQAPPESVGHPVLERPFLPIGKQLPPRVAQRDEHTLAYAEAAQGVERLERIAKELAVIIDTGQPWSA